MKELNLYPVNKMCNYLIYILASYRLWESNKIITKKEINSRNYKIIKRMEVFQSYIFMTITLRSASKK